MNHRLRTGSVVSLAGAVALLASLWLPWYELRLPAGVRDVLTQRASALGGPFAQLAQGLAAAIPDAVQADAWKVLHTTPPLLVLCAAVVVLAVVTQAGVGGDAVRVTPGAAAGVTIVAGVVAGIAVAVAMTSPPGPDGLLHLRYGVWLALAGAVAMVAGGATARSAEPSRPATQPVTRDVPFPTAEPAAAPAPAPASSTPPPGWG